jgi:hypothetical protein
MKNIIIFFSLLLISTFIYSQDSLDTKLKDIKRLGIGFEGVGVNYGPCINYYSNIWLIGFTYGLPQSSDYHGVLKQFDYSLYFRAAIAIGYWYSSISFWPIYIGTGYNFIQEKSSILGYSGDGTISSFSFYAGTRLLEFKEGFFSHIGTHFEFGYTFWNYSNSLLSKNNSDTEYNFSNFYYGVGAYYYIF